MPVCGGNRAYMFKLGAIEIIHANFPVQCLPKHSSLTVERHAMSITRRLSDIRIFNYEAVTIKSINCGEPRIQRTKYHQTTIWFIHHSGYIMRWTKNPAKIISCTNEIPKNNPRITLTLTI